MNEELRMQNEKLRVTKAGGGKPNEDGGSRMKDGEGLIKKIESAEI